MAIGQLSLPQAIVLSIFRSIEKGVSHCHSQNEQKAQTNHTLLLLFQARGNLKISKAGGGVGIMAIHKKDALLNERHHRYSNNGLFSQWLT